MRRLSGEDGAVAVLVALLSVVLFGFGVLVIDVGALYFERRQLQVGADAAALAVAQQCAAGSCGSFAADAEAFADGNALDGAARVTQQAGEAGGPRVCGTGPELPACTDPPTGLVGDGYVRVTTSTEATNGTLLVPPALARVLVPGYQGAEVASTAVVAWGRPTSGASDFPITFDVCEWAAATGADPVAGTAAAVRGRGLGKKADAANASEDLVSNDVVLFMKTQPQKAAGLPACGADANYKDAPGAFGWVTEKPRDDQCSADSKVADKLAVDTGNNIPQECPEAYLASKIGKTIFLPIFSSVAGTGNNVEYEVVGYSAFELTGFRLSGSVAAPAGEAPCANPDRCLSGRFTSAIMPRGGPIGTGPDLGATVLQLVS